MTWRDLVDDLLHKGTIRSLTRCLKRKVGYQENGSPVRRGKDLMASKADVDQRYLY